MIFQLILKMHLKLDEVFRNIINNSNNEIFIGNNVYFFILLKFIDCKYNDNRNNVSKK